MAAFDDTTQTTGELEQVSRLHNQRETLSARRQHSIQQKHTDVLPRLNNEGPTGKIAWRQMVQLRQENKRLRWELAEMEKEREAFSGMQQEAQERMNQLQGLVEERERLEDEYRQMQQRYHELYHSFQDAVEEEAHNMLAEATQTLQLHPDERPPAKNDLMKTVELHVRQVEDKHTAEALHVMRQAQRKAAQLEHQLAREREHLATEHHNLEIFQKRVREQAELRMKTVDAHLRAKYSLTLTLMTAAFLFILPLLQTIFLMLFHQPVTFVLWISLFIPVLICMALAGLIARVRTSARMIVASAPRKVAGKKAPAAAK